MRNRDFSKIIELLKYAEDAGSIDGCREEIAEWIPEVRSMFNYDQKHTAHQYDLWMHCVHTVLGLPRGLDEDMLYLAALLHDIGKPDCQVAGKREGDVNMHYYGHPERSLEIVRDEVIPGLLEKGVPLTEDEQRKLKYYVAYHDDPVSLRVKSLRRHLQIPVTVGEFQNLMLLEVADAKAHVQIPIVARRVEICGQLAGDYAWELYEWIQEEKKRVNPKRI